MHINSIRFKTSILYSVLLAVILTIFATAIYLNVRNILYNDLDKDLKLKADEIITILKAYEYLEYQRNEPINQIVNLIKNHTGTKTQKMVIDELWKAQFNVLNLKKDYINIINIKKESLFTSNHFKVDKMEQFKEQIPSSFNKIMYKDIHYKNKHVRFINLPLRYLHEILSIQVATPLNHIYKTLDELMFFSIISIILLLVITSFIGNLFAEQILRPVMLVSNLADKITHKNLKSRLEEKQKDKEMRKLINSFNTMIERLDNSFNHINEFSSHVAHELKTPLAIIKGELELSLLKERKREEYKDVLEGNLDEINRMIKIINDLLLLAKFDYKPNIFQFKKISITQTLKEIHEQSIILASEKEISVTLEMINKDIIINADKTHLRRLFFNIINNAIRYTNENGIISIKVSQIDTKIKIEISDTGCGIPEEYLSKIFDKFFRINKKDEKSGTGLGLNMAKSIAKAHDGDILASSKQNEGTTFIITLPINK